MLDEQIIDILLNMEKQYRKLRTGEVDYLPEVDEVLEQWYTWRLALNIAKEKMTNCKELNRLASKWNINMINLNNMQFIKINIEHS